jgi:signal transduction histidine kinase
MPAAHTEGTGARSAHSGLAHWFWHDRLLLGALAICALLFSVRLFLTLTQPTWSGPFIDWMRTALAWPELLVVLVASLWLSRVHWRGATSWWMWSAALLTYAVARTLWLVGDQIIYHQKTPFPILPDYLFMLQYPFFFAAVVLFPHTQGWGSRVVMILDGLIVMGAATALSWFFLLEPLYVEGEMTPLAQDLRLAYPVADLFVLFGLTLTLMRPSRYQADRLVLAVLVWAVASLVAADSWASTYLLSPTRAYRAGSHPDLLWGGFYLLIPLAALVQVRLIQHRPPRTVEVPNGPGPLRRDIVASLRLFTPLVVGLLVTTLIEIQAAQTAQVEGWHGEIAAIAVSFTLLLLVTVRQWAICVENTRLQREAEMAQANERAQAELNQRKDEFLSVVAHELKTPLTSLQGYNQLLSRHFNAWIPRNEGAEELARGVELAHAAIAAGKDSLRRIMQLIEDLLDDARLRDGSLILHVKLCDLNAIVCQAVEEQRVLSGDRTIGLHLSGTQAVPILADAARIRQVVANYLTNALKYSKADRPVEVRVEVEDTIARVSVRDEGVGVPPSEQMHVWERFHPIEVNTVQTGSGVSLGIGLHISKGIIEQHHGEVGIESVPEQGSTFWFTIPLASQR